MMLRNLFFSESKALKRYELVKQRMGFECLSLRRKQDLVYIILDGIDLDMKTKGNFI